MLTWIGRGVLVGLLLAQSPEDDSASLEQDRLATAKDSPTTAAVVVIARHVDGSPVRGVIQCSGLWNKYQDGQGDVYVLHLPFKTDARGAIILNPHLGEEWMTCWSSDKGRYGKVLVEFSHEEPVKVVTFVLNERGEE